MAKTDFKNVDEYHATFSGLVLERLQAIRKVIQTTVPEAEEVISYQIPAYKYAGFLIYYSGYAKHISLSYPYSDALLEEFKEELKKYKVSKSAIQFPNDKELPLDLIQGIVKFRVKENLAKEAVSKKKK